jgi:hypothetical protein
MTVMVAPTAMMARDPSMTSIPSGRAAPPAPSAQDHEPDLAGHDPDRRHAGPGREAQALGLGADVADEEGAGHRGRRVGWGVRPAAGMEAGDEPDVDERLTQTIEDAVHECAEPGDPPRRPGERPVQHVEDAAGEDDKPAGQPELEGQEDGPDRGDAEPDEGESVRRQPQPAERERDRLAELLDPAARVVGGRHPRPPQLTTGGA